jgi:hypothetical protein
VTRCFQLVLFSILGGALAVSTVGCGATPQIGANEESVCAADALWTAVTSKRTPLIDNCANKIDALHGSGKLQDDAFQILSGVVASARGGDWAAARNSLKTFLKNQRPTAARNS